MNAKARFNEHGIILALGLTTATYDLYRTLRKETPRNYLGVAF
jgi:hypothetical protein